MPENLFSVPNPNNIWFHFRFEAVAEEALRQQAEERSLKEEALRRQGEERRQKEEALHKQEEAVKLLLSLGMPAEEVAQKLGLELAYVLVLGKS